MADEHDILIDDEGVHFVYDDMLAPVFAGEDQETKRVSRVEPATTFGWEQDGWLADMRLVGGPLLYASVDAGGVKHAFETRQAALDAERNWLRQEKGL